MAEWAVFAPIVGTRWIEACYTKSPRSVKWAGYPHERRGFVVRRPQTAAVPLEQWRRLVQLAHPDKHNGSAAALEATRWLMEHRP
jgi:hypothetical protein